VTEQDPLTLERPDRLALVRLGLSIEEARQLLAALQVTKSPFSGCLGTVR